MFRMAGSVRTAEPVALSSGLSYRLVRSPMMDRRPNQDLWKILEEREAEKRRQNWRGWAITVIVWLLLLAAVLWVSWKF